MLNAMDSEAPSTCKGVVAVKDDKPKLPAYFKSHMRRKTTDFTAVMAAKVISRLDLVIAHPPGGKEEAAENEQERQRSIRH